MTYLISDIHSDYKGFLDILHKISYNNQDMLILVGDIVDRGAEPLRLKICEENGAKRRL